MNKINGSPSIGLFSATLGFFVGFAAVALFGPTANKFKDIMQLSPLMIGFLVAVPSLSGSLLRIPFGAWVDTTGGRKPFLVLLVLSFVGMLALFSVIYFLYPNNLNASYYPLLLLLGILCGCGIATFSVGVGQVSYWFPQKKQGRALGVYGGVGNMAPGIFSLLLPLSLANWGLQASYLAWLIFLVIGIVIYAITSQNAPYFQLIKNRLSPAKAREVACGTGQELFPAGNATECLGVAARIWKTWILVLIYFTTFGGFIALTAWFPTYWTSFFGQTIAVAGVLTAIYSLTTSVVRIGGGSISDKLGGERTLLFSLVVLLVGSLVMLVSHNFALSIFGAVVMAVGMGVGNASVFKLVPQEVKEAVGGAAGWVGGLGAFGGFAIPPLMSMFVSGQSTEGYATGFVIYTVLAVISMAAAYSLMRAHRGAEAAARRTVTPSTAS